MLTFLLPILSRFTPGQPSGLVMTKLRWLEKLALRTEAASPWSWDCDRVLSNQPVFMTVAASLAQSVTICDLDVQQAKSGREAGFA